MNAKMSELKQCLEAAGFKEVKTVLASGNVTFVARRQSEQKLQQKLEAAMTEHLDRSFRTIVRAVDDLRAILEADPYAAFRVPSTAKRVITFLRNPPQAKSPLRVPIRFEDAQILRVDPREVYSVYIPGPRGPLFMNLIEKTFGKEVTTRTWDTLKKVAR